VVLVDPEVVEGLSAMMVMVRQQALEAQTLVVAVVEMDLARCSAHHLGVLQVMVVPESL
jgi:ABC-type histidine transport system ATPase subunit